MKKWFMSVLCVVCAACFLAGCGAVLPSATTTVPNTTDPSQSTTTTMVPPSTSGWEIVGIVLTTDGFDMELETFYYDEENEYKFSVRMSPYIIVHYSNGTQENIKTALFAGRATLADLDRFGFQYYTYPKTN